MCSSSAEMTTSFPSGLMSKSFSLPVNASPFLNHENEGTGLDGVVAHKREIVSPSITVYSFSNLFESTSGRS